MASVLVTGGAGFIGSHLVERLLNEGNRVFVVDDLSTGRRENLVPFEKNRNFFFFHDTILNERRINTLMKRCEVVYHLAAAVGVKYIIDNPLLSLKTNVVGCEIVLKAASDYSCKVILTSSSEVYGKNEKDRLKEDDDRIQGSTKIIRWGYSCSKALDEFMALAYFREKNLPAVIARLFNICGPRQRPDFGMVIPRFVRQALSGEAITVYGSGKQIRAFLHVRDAVEALVRLANSKEAVGEIINVGSDNPIAIIELAGRIKVISQSSSPITRVSYDEAYGPGFEDMRYRVPDIGKLRTLVGFQPKKSLDDILGETIECFRKVEKK